MIIYMTEGGKYFPVNAEKPRGLYINLTNRCNNDCPFCLREKKIMTAENSLWLESEPTADEVKKALNAAPLDIPTKIPSLLAKFLLNLKASSFSTAIISS